MKVGVENRWDGIAGRVGSEEYIRKLRASRGPFCDLEVVSRSETYGHEC